MGVCVEFRTPIFRKGLLVTHPRAIAKQYARTWLSIDLLVVLPLALWQDGAALAFVASLKLLRCLRLFHFLSRLQKDCMLTKLLPIKVALVVMLFVHAMACGWRLAEHGGHLPVFQMGTSWTDLYVQDTYWILMTMTTVGYGDIFPTGTGGRLYAIMVMLMAPIFFGSVMSVLSHVMRSIFEDRTEGRILEAMRFMRRRRLPPELQARVEQSLRHNLVGDRQVALDPELFVRLSPTVQQELSLALLSSTALRFPLFRGAAHAFVAELAQAHTWVQCMPGDLVAEEDQLVEEIVFVVQGRLVVQFGRGSNNVLFDIDVATGQQHRRHGRQQSPD